jgi:hypothetical protein
MVLASGLHSGTSTKIAVISQRLEAADDLVYGAGTVLDAIFPGRHCWFRHGCMRAPTVRQDISASRGPLCGEALSAS